MKAGARCELTHDRQGREIAEPARSGPDGEKRRGWRPLTVVVAAVAALDWLVLTAVAVLVHPDEAHGGTHVHRFLADVRDGKVVTGQIDANGAVTGTLKGDGQYSTQIPTALQGTGLAAEL